MRTIKQACVPRRATFDPTRRDTVLDLTDLIDDRIDPAEFFAAVRIGCEACGFDLNPVAALLTWGALHIVGGGREVAEGVRQAQAEVFEAVDRQVAEWRIEHNAVGWRADAFLYCTEAVCPECGWRVPLAPSWVIGEKTRTVAQLTARPAERRFVIATTPARPPGA